MQNNKKVVAEFIANIMGNFAVVGVALAIYPGFPRTHNDKE